MEHPKFRFDQEDLRARSLEPAVFDREYYRLNQLYGAAEILRQFAGLPGGKPIPWAVQAVIGFDEFPAPESAELMEKAERVLRRLLDSRLTCVFTVDQGRERMLRPHWSGEIYPVGSMFLYARELYRRSGFETPVVRRGTIALPDKSDLGKILDFDREAYAGKLAALPEEFQPVYVSMHWRDFERRCHEPYLRAGLRMVCSGHPYEPVFYQRLHDVCRQFKYSCSNEISTSFALSVMSGCQFFFLDGGPVTIERSFKNKFYKGPEPTLDYPAKQICIAASPFPPVENGRARQRELAGIACGESYMRTPEFFQAKWERSRRALSDRLPVAALKMTPPPEFSEFANWLPAGFDGDGWADAECSLEVPVRAGYSGVEIELAFPLLNRDEATSFLRVWLDGDPVTGFHISIDRARKIIFIGTRDDGAPRRIEFAGPAAVPLPGESRARSFLLVGITWRKQPVPPPTPAVVGEQKKPTESTGRAKRCREILSRIFERGRRDP